MRTTEEARLRLIIEAREEHAAGVERNDYPAKVYAQAALGLLSGAEHEDRGLVRARMFVAVNCCLEAARLLLWGNEKLRARDVN